MIATLDATALLSWVREQSGLQAFRLQLRIASLAAAFTTLLCPVAALQSPSRVKASEDLQRHGQGARQFGTSRKGEEPDPQGCEGGEEEEADGPRQEALRVQPPIRECGEEWSEARSQFERWQVRCFGCEMGS
eukprot:s611_g20.t1